MAVSARDLGGGGTGAAVGSKATPLSSNTKSMRSGSDGCAQDEAGGGTGGEGIGEDVGTQFFQGKIGGVTRALLNAELIEVRAQALRGVGQTCRRIRGDPEFQRREHFVSVGQRCRC